MADISTKIMGMTLNIAVDDCDVLKTEAIVNYANEIYSAVRKDYDRKIVDSSRLRAVAVYRLVSELQAIKGEKQNLLDTSTKKINDLIKIVDSVNLQN